MKLKTVILKRFLDHAGITWNSYMRIKINFVSGKLKGYRGFGIIERQYGWRLLLWWCDIVINTDDRFAKSTKRPV